MNLSTGLSELQLLDAAYQTVSRARFHFAVVSVEKHNAFCSGHL